MIVIVLILHISACLSLNFQNGRGMRLQADSPYIRELEALSTGIKSKFFFPGHNGGIHAPSGLSDAIHDRALQLDLPELDGLGNVHDFSLASDDALSRALKAAASLYEAARTWFLVNGSTSGILIAALVLKELHTQRLEIEGKCGKKSVIIISRDAHKAVFDALELSQSEALVLPCDIDDCYGISRGPDLALGRITKIIHDFRRDNGDKADIAGIIITRPTYQGLGLRGEDFKVAVGECHEAGVPVVVDEAHGSHWHFLPKDEGYGDALSCGADLVIQSSHKTLGALSQAGMLHLSETAFSCGDGGGESSAAEEVVHHFYSMLTTTSPNSLLLASLDAARTRAEREGPSLVAATATAVRDLKESVTSCCGSGNVSFLDSTDSHVVDPLRLSVHFPRYPSSAMAIDEWLCEQRGLWCELNLPRCIVYCVPMGATETHLLSLREGLCGVLERVQLPALETGTRDERQASSSRSDFGEGLLYMPAIRRKNAVSVPTEEAEGMVSAENVVPYPPGIPILLRGEKISAGHMDKLRELRKMVRDKAWGGSVLSADQFLVSLSVYEH